MAAITTAVLAAGALAYGAYSGKRQHDAAKKADKEQAAARRQMESDVYNQQSAQSMKLLRQRILASRGGGSSPFGAGSGMGLGGIGTTPDAAPQAKTALGA